jgi:hypothetical protein
MNEYIETVWLYKGRIIMINHTKDYYYICRNYYWYDNEKTHKKDNILFKSKTLQGIKNKITRFVKKV